MKLSWWEVLHEFPWGKKSVEDFFGKSSNNSVNPDEVVALGAAVQGGVFSGDINDVLLLDVTPLSMGIETLGGVSTVLIPRNTTIPTTKTETFSTAADNQSAVDIHALQGERKFAGDNRTLGRLQLSGIPPAPRGIPQIEVTFDLDANGILSVSAKDKATGKEQSIRIEGQGGLSDADIESMVADAEAAADEDRQRFEEVEERNKLDTLVYQARKMVEENKENLSVDTVQTVSESIDSAQNALDSGDDMTAAFENLQSTLHTLSAELYQATQEASTAEENVDEDFAHVDERIYE